MSVTAKAAVVVPTESKTPGESFEKVMALIDRFKVDAEKTMKGNNAAGVRSRKTSLEIDAELKAWRKVTLQKE